MRIRLHVIYYRSVPRQAGGRQEWGREKNQVREWFQIKFRHSSGPFGELWHINYSNGGKELGFHNSADRPSSWCFQAKWLQKPKGKPQKRVAGAGSLRSAHTSQGMDTCWNGEGIGGFWLECLLYYATIEKDEVECEVLPLKVFYDKQWTEKASYWVTYSGVFPDTEQFSNTSWVFNDSVRFWHWLPGISTRSHKLKGSVPQHCPQFRCQSQVPGCHLYSGWLAIYKSGSQDPLLRFNKLLEWLTGIRKASYLHLQVMIKDTAQE